MSSISEFNKAVAKSAIAYGTLKQKTAAFEVASKEMSEASAANDVALEEVKQLIPTLDETAIKSIQASQ